MKITFLGTGTSHGVPVIGCDCPVCSSADIHDKRYRSSLLIESESTSVIIDTGYEFRLQCLRAGIRKVDGILYTHAHSDHLMGLDDLRVFTKYKRMPIFSFLDILDDIAEKFPYAFTEMGNMGLPQLDRYAITPYEEFSVGDISFIPIPVMHGVMQIAGFRFGSCAYITDVSDILLSENKKYLDGVDILIIGALRELPHATHYSFSEAVDVATKLNASSIYFTHINHAHSHREIAQKYRNVAIPAYDGLVLEV